MTASWTRRTRDPFVVSCTVAVALVLAGLAFLAAAWHGSARTVFVPFQFPWVVSAGVGGLALVGSGSAVLVVQAGRHAAARRRQELDSLTDQVVRVIDAMVDRRSAGGGP